MILLAGRHYDSTTDQLTLVGNKCPTRKQNKEYILYLLKVLYTEANVSSLTQASTSINIIPIHRKPSPGRVMNYLVTLASK